MIYVNFDLETTGGNPEKNAIISIGAVAHRSDTWEEIGEYDEHLIVPADRTWDYEALKWWLTDPEAGGEKLKQIFDRASQPDTVCLDFMGWLKGLSDKEHSTRDENMTGPFDTRVAFVANPIAFDLPFLRSYMKQYVGEAWSEWADANKSGLGGVDLPTLAMTVLPWNTDLASERYPAWVRAYPDARRRLWIPAWSDPDQPHTHMAIDDARHQAFAFIKMMKHLEDIRGAAFHASPVLFREFV
jgi:hypothetical protein